jgi:hypothetical protein
MKERPYFYVLEALEIRGKDKRKDKASRIIYSLYIKWSANRVLVETNSG